MDPIETSLDIEEAAAAWIAKRDTGSWSAHDQAAFQAWLDASTAHRIEFLRQGTAWDGLSALASLGAPAGIAESSPVPAETSATAAANFDARGRRRSRTYSLVAALFMVCLTAGVWYFRANMGAPYSTVIGTVANLVLADGTRAVLDSNSRMIVTMSGNARHVALERGAAFFDIARDPSRPFVVDVGRTRLTDQGTRFSVRQDRDEVIVLVADGKVAVEDPDSTAAARTALLDAGTEAHISSSRLIVNHLTSTRVEEHLSWRTGHLVFHDTALSDAIAEFNRYSPRRLVMGSSSLAGIRIGGNFRISDLDGFVSLLKRGFPIRAEETANQIVLTQTGQD